MDAEFWHDKWNSQQVGFHRDSVNSLLKKHWPDLGLTSNSTIFVPLCGKTLDMCFLAQSGHQVIGCELSDVAVRQFFDENKLSFKLEKQDEFQCYLSDSITLYRGDFFSLPRLVTKVCDGFYDRAALIAWPEHMRVDYVKKLAELLPVGAKGLLVSLDYPQADYDGPPFAVSHDWIMANMTADFDISLLSELEVLNDNPKFVVKNVPWLTESVYKLVRK